jgi:hypothetical protein
MDFEVLIKILLNEQRDQDFFFKLALTALLISLLRQFLLLKRQSHLISEIS